MKPPAPIVDASAQAPQSASAALDLREFAERMSEAEQIAHFGAWRWDVGTGQVRWSDELHRIYGLEPGQFAGTLEAFLAHLHPDDHERVWTCIEQALRDLEPFAFEERILRADGAERVLLSQGRPLVGDGGQAEALVGVCYDITERVEAERALGLSERRMRAIIDNTPSMVAVKGLDGRYLMANAESGRIAGRPADELIGRDCGEVFPKLAERLRMNDRLALDRRVPVYDEVEHEVGGETRHYLLATFALPDHDGRPIETCTIATDVTERRELEGERRRRLEWSRRIHSALTDGRMLVFAQPVVELATGNREWCELLVRMSASEPEGELLQPGSFLPAAERFGLIQAIDVWMVGQAIGLTGSFAPAVNLSAVTLCDPAARSDIVALLAAAPEAARRIVFEITETAAAEHVGAALEFAGQLAELGCGLALDDFGTGFGSFTYLRTLPLRYLKIDRSFVLNLASSVDDRRVVQSIVGIAEQFGLRTIAEGVEDQATLELLGTLGADYVQGFHLGRPAPIG